jgi:endonuclease YncB( thermonuclease family)
VVTHVVDGDTVDVEGVGRIRVIGIDTPERGACGYDSATLAMAALVLGESVTLVPGAAEDVDRYGRLLRYVDVAGTDAGLSLIEDGWAIARYDSRDGYGAHPREASYVAADQSAEDLGCYPDDEP